MTLVQHHATTDRAARVAAVVADIDTTPAIDNDFYRLWMGGPLPYPAVRVFAREYLSRTRFTAVMVALSVLNTTDLAARVECVKNLYSEYGNGNAEKAHLVLLENFLCDLLSRLAGHEVSTAELSLEEPLPSTAAFSAGQRELFSSTDQRVVQGALLAQEHLAFAMLTRLYEGVRNYKPLWPREDDFHEACEYFYVHIGEAEKEHKREAITSAAAVCRTEGDFAVLVSGYDTFLTLTAEYWRGVHRAVTAADDDSQVM
ncbi:iron-containing redox enzyme family protein [Actinokineospora diospyrosa]|uniref:Pyrroloquinoline quinone (PQQ) biosynthesis protein C n=1 Tax=Actinokineospora diospyrosa TaxID=103728 RepID=A0ABT1IFL0_9PSEU|nr:iron-containing redox enzyme family protein [Actinokineospora diospyrosa]MCP2271438.1 Pyrroloquinoline quinone (PQQ) biosynthesis protein C [Actinokineospora diospyrosa]